MYSSLVRSAVVADTTEIRRLEVLFSDYHLERHFCKTSKSWPQPVGSSRLVRTTSPYHYLRTDLGLLLGISGTKLLNRIWSKYQLSPAEQDKRRLRPALLKLFSVAARIAATKGVGHALKRLAADFERKYFTIASNSAIDRQQKETQRFALLSMLSAGRGIVLLHGVLSQLGNQANTHRGEQVTSPSDFADPLPHQARRAFLFQASCRAKNWTEAYTQSRRLTPHQRTEQRNNIRKSCQQLLSSPMLNDKKKSVLEDLADTCEAEKRLELLFLAQSIDSRTCRPGHLEDKISSLIPAEGRLWNRLLITLYRHRAVPHRWTSDLRQLWRNEPNLRGLLGVFFNILRYSSPRAQHSLKKYQLHQTRIPLQLKNLQERIGSVRKQVQQWQTWVPILPQTKLRTGSPVELNREQWSHLTSVCGRLFINTPQFVMSQVQPYLARMIEQRDVLILSVSPTFFHLNPGEQNVILAQTAFRHTCGLDDLRDSVSHLNSSKAVYSRALQYAEWKCHRWNENFDLMGKEQEARLVIVALEEMYWETQDENYRLLAQSLNQQGWCPPFDREADLFAAHYADIVTVCHAIVKNEIEFQQVHTLFVKDGLEGLIGERTNDPVCLRLQSLWTHYIELLRTR